MMRSILLCGVAVCIALPAHAQRADDNAVTAAEDAFGATIGNESIGIYSARRVRGFSPVEAGNVRIEGLYMDRQGTLPPRLVEGIQHSRGPVGAGLSVSRHPPASSTTGSKRPATRAS